MVNHASRRHITGRGGTPINTIIVFVPQQEAWVVERFGKYARILEPVCMTFNIFFSWDMSHMIS